MTTCSKDLFKLARMLARAFHADPLYRYAFPDAVCREAHTAWDMETLVRYGMMFGQVHAAPLHSGCIVWLPPGETHFSEERCAQAGMLDMPAFISPDSAQRLNRFVDDTEVVHDWLAPEAHYYLVLLGVSPARQGEGIGSALLAPLLLEANSSNCAVYLETTNGRNISYYQKHGFEVRHNARLSDGSIEVWYMIRDPQKQTKN